MSPVAAQQVLSSMHLLAQPRGLQKIRQLKENCNYFRWRLLEMGYHCLGDWDSPIIPVMVYRPSAMALISRECLKRNVAIVIVGFPATSLSTSRIRICISAAHKRSDLDYCLKVMHKCGVLTGSMLNRTGTKNLPSLDTFIRHATDSKAALLVR